MTTTKLPPDMVLATPIGGKDIDPELEAKLKDKKNKHKRHRFQVLITQRLKDAKFRFKQIKNCGNRSNYIYTENEAKQVVRLYELMLEEAKEAWLEVDSYNLKKLLTYDQTELD